MNEITIKALSPDLEKDYFDFFDNRAFSDGSPYYPCYCNAFNMSAGEIEAMRDQAKQYGGGIEGWKRSLRETAVRMVRQGLIRGYLAFDDDLDNFKEHCSDVFQSILQFGFVSNPF